MTDTHQPHKYSRTPFDKDQIAYRIITALVIVLIFIIGGALYFHSKGVFGKDSGVAACEQMAVNAKDGKKSDKKTLMTEAQYKEKRAPFENSKYADIKVAGTNLVETIYKADHAQLDDTLGSSIVLLTTVQTQYGALQTACAAHGVDLPSLTTT